MNGEEFCGSPLESFILGSVYLGSRPTQQTKCYTDFGDNNIMLFCDTCGTVWGARMRSNAVLSDPEIRKCKKHGGGSFFSSADYIFRYALPQALLEYEAHTALINDRPDTAY